MKSGCALKKKRLKVAIYIVHLISYSAKKKCSLALCLQVLKETRDSSKIRSLDLEK